ncbi:hypothetical protein M9Y10_020342 [Tritrichomonas musculus]|uniref:Glycoside hydrolase family 5 domain-containing protein n=1 Tax=Tritrichomonas musculus TaxID=1915356 RepID=A0ABR2HGU5_9EUKA
MKLLYESDFSVEQTKEGWSFRKNTQYEQLKIDSRNVLKITYCDAQNAYTAVSYTIKNLQQFIGQGLLFTVDIKAENVSVPPQKWNGIKFMFVYSINGTKNYPQDSPANHGTFDWTKAQFYVSIPKEVSETGSITFGLQASSGTVYFSNLRIEYGQIFPSIELPPNFKCEYTPLVSSKPQMRGVMSPSKYIQNDLTDLRKWNANIIRWQMNGGNNVQNFLQWLDEKIIELDSALKENEENHLNINFVVDLHSGPGGRNSRNEYEMYFNEEHAQTFFKAWEKLANHFKGKNGIWAYDLINEPVQVRITEENRDYLSMQFEAAKRIRQIDPITPIIIESNQWDNSSTFNYLHPLPLTDIIYEVHMYYPHSFTHQNVGGGKWSNEKIRSYPGNIDGKNYDRNALEEYLKPTIEFQNKYGARIFLGEFSAIRWGEGADIYIEDVISIAEKYHWDWTYHAYREWNGWSVEHVEDHEKVEKANYITKRKIVLLKYFQRNSCE